MVPLELEQGNCHVAAGSRSRQQPRSGAGGGGGAIHEFEEEEARGDAAEQETQGLIAAHSVGKGSSSSRPAPAVFGAPSSVNGRDSSDDVGRGAVDIESSVVPSGPTKRLWRVWPSKNLFFCRGLLITGGSDECFAPNLCVWTCVLVPSSLYFFWVFPHLWRRGAYALPGATLCVFLVTTGFLLATCCTDPGIIPRREVILATGTAAKLQAQLGYDVLGGSGEEADIPQHLRSQGYRWCRTCHIVRPPRASHCHDCDNCVLRYDHHCPFVNNCVGQRNYHFFFGFVTMVMVLALMVLPAVFTFFSALDIEASLEGMIKLSAVLRLVFYAIIGAAGLVILATVFSCVLWLYHVFLIASNRTTKEFRKSVPNIAEEPTFWAPRGARLFNPRALVDARCMPCKPVGRSLSSGWR